MMFFFLKVHKFSFALFLAAVQNCFIWLYYTAKNCVCMLSQVKTKIFFWSQFLFHAWKTYYTFVIPHLLLLALVSTV